MVSSYAGTLVGVVAGVGVGVGEVDSA